MKKFRKKVVKAYKKGLLAPYEAVEILTLTGLSLTTARETLRITWKFTKV